MLKLMIEGMLPRLTVTAVAIAVSTQLAIHKFAERSFFFQNNAAMTIAAKKLSAL
jgi:hypothetical protein